MTNASTLFATDTGLTVNLDHTLDNPNAGGSSALQDRFGSKLAISGNYAIFGVQTEDEAPLDSSGKAYIFDVSTGTLVHTLDNPNAFGSPDNDYFGSDVGISGNYAIVGASGEDDAVGSQSGKAYIFNVSTGALVHTLDNPNAYVNLEPEDRFGNSVGISGNYAIVGARTEDDDPTLGQSGKAYIFNVSTGALVHTLDNPNAYGTVLQDQFGWDVDISGNYAAVSTYLEDDAGGTTSGKAYIFNVSTGELLHTLDNPNASGSSADDWFGYSVRISGNYVIVGAPFDEDSSSGLDSGKAYIFNASTGVLVHTLENPNVYDAQDDDRFGWDVGISGNYAIVSAYFEHGSITANNAGKAYIFDVSTGTLVHTLDNPNAFGSPDNDSFGTSLGISGNYVIVGASEEDETSFSSSGKAYIYSLKDVPGYDASVDTIIPEELLIDPTVYTAAFVASKNRLHKLDVSGGSFTVDMPLSPVEGDRVEFRFVNGSSPATNNLTFSKGATSAEIENDTADFTWDVDSPKTVAWIYTTEDGWIIR